MKRFVVATRASRLALVQAREVAAGLAAAHAELEPELLPLSTRGDQLLDRSLAPLGGKGLFVKALEFALEHGRARLAVHSLKDVPAVLDGRFVLAAVTARLDPRDVLIARAGAGDLDSLPRRARVGTASLRRQAQLLSLRSDLEILPLRGSIERRLERLDLGELDAIVLAAAGLRRLGMDRGTALPPEVMIPAAGQGSLALETAAADAEAVGLAQALEDHAARLAAGAERAFCRALGASCAAPVGAYATVDDGRLTLHVRVAAADGSKLLAGSRSGAAGEAEALGEDLAAELLARGAGALIGSDGTPA